MKLAIPALALVTVSVAFAVTVGETFEQVVAEKGHPLGVLNAGNVQIVKYPDMVLKVREGVVSTISGPEKAHYPYGTTPPASATAASFSAPVHASSAAAHPQPARRQAPDPALSSAANAPEYRGPPVWEADMGSAMHEAHVSKRHILVLFTGSDWCTWCQKMDDEVFSQHEFAVYTHEKYVIVKLDYPKETPQPDSVKRENAEMLRRFDVRGFPNAIIMDENSRVLTRIEGYQEGGSSNFIRLLRQYE
ncbi:MAG TPA: thioredoxin family protein [Opitutaceae bacterium]|nr:thioredoxin family protein [Opitutaceae bacterium]